MLIDCKCAVLAGQRFLESPEGVQNHTAVGVDLGRARRKGQQLVVAGQRLGVDVQLLQAAPEIVQDIGPVRSQPGGQAIGLQRLAQPAEFAQRIAAVVVGIGSPRLERGTARKVRQRPFAFAKPAQCHAAMIEDRGDVLAKGKGTVEELARRRVVTRLKRAQSTQLQGVEIPSVDREDLGKEGAGLGGLTRLQMRQPAPQQSFHGFAALPVHGSTPPPGVDLGRRDASLSLRTM